MIYTNMVVPNKVTQICLALHQLAVARLFDVAKHKIAIHLWGTTMQCQYNKKVICLFQYYDSK